MVESDTRWAGAACGFGCCTGMNFTARIRLPLVELLVRPPCWLGVCQAAGVGQVGGGVWTRGGVGEVAVNTRGGVMVAAIVGLAGGRWRVTG